MSILKQNAEYAQRFSMFYSRYSEGWFLSSFTFCCQMLTLAYERGDIKITAYSPEIDKYRIWYFNSRNDEEKGRYISRCPFCDKPIYVFALDGMAVDSFIVHL